MEQDMAGSFNTVTSALALAVASLSFTITPAMAAEPGDGAPVILVHYDDLDLSTAKGRERLDVRVRRATAKLCGDFGGDLTARKLAMQCREAVMSKTQPQVALAFAAHKKGEAHAFNQATIGTPNR
jgi:UrcA family protein